MSKPKKKQKGYHVGDLVVWDSRRMRVAAFPTDNLVLLTAMVVVTGKPSHVTVSMKDLLEKAKRVTLVRGTTTEEKE